MSKALNAETVLTRTKAGTLENVKNLNLWGNDIDDISILREMPNLEVISLSVNKINSLKYFQYCKKLTELYLRKNLIADLREVKYLQNLQGLKVLWLWDNPCADSENYRSTVLSMLPNLVKLDNQNVTSEERNSLKSTENLKSHEQPKKEIKKEEPRREISREPLRPKSRNEPKIEKSNENVLCAVLALLKELDESGLELVKRDIERKLANK